MILVFDLLCQVVEASVSGRPVGEFVQETSDLAVSLAEDVVNVVIRHGSSLSRMGVNGQVGATHMRWRGSVRFPVRRHCKEVELSQLTFRWGLD